MSIKAKISDLIIEFCKKHKGKRPTKLHLSTEDECEILKLPATEIGSTLASKILIEGIDAFRDKDNKYFLFGLEIMEFNADVTSVSNCED